MDSLIERRKKDFKKTFDDSRRRREEQRVQIRKQNREAMLETKRQAALEGVKDGSRPGVTLPHDLSQLPKMVASLMSSNPEEQFLATEKFRKLLSIEEQPPIQEVIDAKVVPRLVEFLKDESRAELQFEAAWALTNIASGNQAQTKVVVQHGAVPIFVQLLSSPSNPVREQAVWALGNIAGDCASLRDLVYKTGGLKPLLEQINSAARTPSPVMLRNAAWTLSNLCRGKPRPALAAVTPALHVLKELIYVNDLAVLTDACWALSFLSDGNDKESNLAIEAVINAGVAKRLVQLLSFPDDKVQTPALRTVGNIVSGNEGPTQVMVDEGCVPALKRLLDAPKTALRKEACWTLSNITAGNPAQIDAVIKEGVIPLLVGFTEKAIPEIRKEAYWALANAASGANQLQIEYLVESHIIRPLCDALEADQEKKLLTAALEALEKILAAGKAIMQERQLLTNPYVLLVEEGGGFPKLERLQFDGAGTAFTIAMKIMTNYMQYDEDEGVDISQYSQGSQGKIGGDDGRFAVDPSLRFDFTNNNMEA